MKSLSLKLEAVFVIGMVVFGCAGMREAQWKFLGSTDLYEGFYYVSKSHLLYKGTLRVWIRLEYTKKGVAEYVKELGKDYENLSYSLQLWEIDCPARRESISSTRLYSVEGNIIKTKSAKGHLSESLSRSLFEAVCD